MLIKSQSKYSRKKYYW